MGICEKCQLLASGPINGSQSRLVSNYDYLSLRKAVDSRCFICLRVWESLTEEQKGIVSTPDFTGITYKISRRSRQGEGEEDAILATLSFEHGDDLYECDDYNKPGGLWIDSAGVFAFVHPSGE